ncbi:hypothetical protein DPM19_09035 [Actinomadura craniellae]|uniref:Peptidoglycan binding-like domain-containing protein n=1 Tax=Actinomadura craniellae TaxID=2231787 RepID=A0A365H9S0_9ACTN|nr:peptidoglycan-binding protein [Actinomadura craniellae]RAY15890.1 hypothetical protein DPM19_09035 [Actinomadura craniellae]
MRRKQGLAAAAAVLACGAAAGLVLTGRDAPAAAPEPLATAEVTRGDLVDTVSVEGELGHRGERELTAARAGTVTSVPAPGAVVGQGGALYAVDLEPVVLMYGTVPLYRPLRMGVPDGPDVRQLERALRALGYGAGLTVDRHFSAATAHAVRRWQHAAGLPRTGAVTAGQVVFLPSQARIAETPAAVGAAVAPGRPVLTVTGTARAVHVELRASRRDLVRKGVQVTVELPGGTTARGRVVSVGATARKPEEEGAEATLDVKIELTGRAGTGGLDRAPVTVALAAERRRNVLSVPVEALLALRAGGYGVEVVEPSGARRVLAVRTGAYGSGRVEVSAAGLRAGLRVGVPEL